MEDIAGSGPVKFPIDSHPWDTILEFVLLADSSCEVRAMDMIFEVLDEAVFSGTNDR
jgi:hypothetical protein